MSNKSSKISPEEQEWARKQVAQYTIMYQSYSHYAETLNQVLEMAVKEYAPDSIVQTRPKSVASFAGKIWRKKSESHDPVNQFTDLCGGRVIVHTQKEIQAISSFIEKNFEIDWENTVDVVQRLKPTEFGYRSIHYIVLFKPDTFPQKAFEVEVPPEIHGLKAEIQIRTFFEHAWADLSHLMLYKKSYPAPLKWQRELAALAALLEEADTLTSRIEKGLRIYNSSYGVYLSEEEVEDEIATLENVLEYDPHNIDIAIQIGRLALNIGGWKKIVDVLSKFKDSSNPELLKNLGTALCKMHDKNPESIEYKEGQDYLKDAVKLAGDDPNPVATLAGSFKGVDDEQARNLYSEAFEIDPSDPYSLNNYLDFEIREKRDLSLIKPMKPVIQSAIKRSRELADVGVEVPWAYYNLGKFYLLLDDPYTSLRYYAKAIQSSNDSWMLETSLKSLEMLKSVGKDLKGYSWVYRILLLGLSSKFQSSKMDEIKNLAKDVPLKEPVVIVAGGTDRKVDTEIGGYEKLLLDVFKDFQGTIISGGTTSGISGLVSKVQQHNPELCTIGYLPRLISAKTSRDERYSNIRLSDGSRFSPLEPLNFWTDLIASNIKPGNVKLLGINGGRISAVEFRIALALGATIGIVKESGREAAKIAIDPDWKDSPNLILLPKDAMTVKAFVGSKITTFNASIREKIAESIHHDYQLNQLETLHKDNPSMQDWDSLAENLKDSNREQADHILEKLKEIGYSLRKVEKNEIKVLEFSDDEVEKMAEMEHGRWNVERLLDGWRWGPTKDVTKKISLYLVPWDELSHEVKEWDRKTVQKIPQFLADVGFEVYRI